ncbi:MAG: cytochrome P450 [Planctomycetes bacterium]|nr:cytochrome P450 [Planctomycetota bacterium]
MAEISTSSTMPKGDSPELLRQIMTDSVGGFSAVHRAHGDVVAYWKGGVPIVFVVGPEFARDMLADKETYYIRAGHPGSKGSAQRSFMNGMFGVNGNVHTQYRRMYMPALKRGSVETQFEAMNRLADDVVSGWREHQTRDLVRDMKNLAMSVTGRMLFGLSDLTAARHVEAYFDHWVMLNHQTLFASILPVDDLPNPYPELLDASEEIRNRLIELLKEKRKAAPAAQSEFDLLATLLSVQERGLIGEQEVIGQLHSLFNAAHHTTSYALTWTLFLIAQHPAIARRLVDEIQTNAPSDDSSLDQLNRCEHLERVIRESLRLIGPLVYMSREATCDAPLGRYQVPRGTVVLVSQYNTHHRAADFANPETFNPDRWKTMGPCPYSYLPFGQGTRMCMGAPFALQFMKVVVAMITRRFRLTIAPGTTINRRSSLTLGPAGPLPVLIHRQDGLYATSAVHGQVLEMVTLPTADRTAIAA